MKRLLILSTILFIFASNPKTLLGQSDKIFKTHYTTIHYAEDKDLEDFIWRLGGQRIEFSTDTALVSNRVDRIVERVKTILDMYPKKFSVNIYLHRGSLEPDRVAFYEHKTRSIHVSVDYMSDGVFAHEIAHAIINQYFVSAPPSKIQEILTQYVDKYLWSE